MLYLFYGSQSELVAEKAAVFVDVLKQKKPEAPLITFDEETISIGSLEEFTVTRGLFETNNIVILKDALAVSEIADYVEHNAGILAASNTVFVFKERKVAAPLKKIFAKHAKKVWSFDKEAGKDKRDTLGFELADALGARNREKAWVLLTKALHTGHEPEQIHGTIFWQIKNLLSVAQAERVGPHAVKKLALNPFVERKTRGFVRNFKEKELQTLSSSLVSLYHEARLGGEDLAVGLERFVLSI
ncbi:MAG: hypothetical protein HY457_01250 [Parcubacteria group bacterium]|nr:hypothetical protein [Parcubacteria group bacterium]